MSSLSLPSVGTVIAIILVLSSLLDEVHTLTNSGRSRQRQSLSSSPRHWIERIHATLPVVVVVVGHTHHCHGAFTCSTLLSLSSASSSSIENNNVEGDDDYLSTSYSSLVGTTADGDASIQILREKARKLREEIELFEQKKNKMEDVERKKRQEELDEQQATIDRYSVIVPILKMDGTTVEEKIQFPPRLTKLGTTTTITPISSEIILCEAPLPLGILLGEHETLSGMTVVDEVLVGSNGEIAGVKEGDLLRACTACKMEMELPTWQLIAGGIGRPKTVRFMFSIDYKPFEQVMGAVGSNRMDPEGRSVLLVLERLTQ